MRINTGEPIPFTVVGGFLGAGKTTLVNALLRQAAGLRLAVLVNDFGSIAIDAALIESSTGDTIALTNGCICCAIGDDFAAGIEAMLRRRPTPDHILVEASGVANPGAIAQIALLDPDLTLAGVLVLADAESLPARLADPRLGDTLRRQLRAADLLVLTKTDLAPAGPVLATLRALAPQAAIVEGADLPLAIALGHHAQAGPRPSGHGVAFATVTLHPSRPLATATLRLALDALPEGVLRAKGLLCLDGRPALVQRVGRRLAITACDAPVEEALVLIGDDTVWDAAAALAALGLERR
ncbi:MAG: GTP-binding protein [Acetobacteraceae bacterium]|nr:MAG: GTP-binding protein [Acetobacteraceae bacterium]